MQDPVTNRVAAILATDPDVFVPVKRLYNELSHEGLLPWTNLESFQMLLECDTRFEFVEGPAEANLCEADVELMEELGFYGGPRVKLYARELAPEEMLLVLLRNLQHMNTALEAAWQHRPTGDEEAETQLTQMLLVGDMMEREIRQMLEEEATGNASGTFNQSSQVAS
jgi:hypothetical protein